ncbi:MAG: tripartite tricarboxylate transporter TctB family protein [Spirochaetaceae bacterium]
MNSKRIDLGVGSGLSLLSIIVFLYAGQYKGAGVSQYGPNFFPQALCILMLTASILLIIQAVKGNSQKDLETIDKKGFIRASITLAICIVYLFVMQLIGFFFATLIFLYVLMTYIGHKHLKTRIISTLSVSLAVYGIFYFFLKIPLPEGIIFRLISGGGM